MARALAVVAVMAVAVFGMASAATYNVGEPSGSWDLQTSYVDWVASKSFHPGDDIVFRYSPQLHDVVEVTKAGYDSCSTSNAITTLRTGNDIIRLQAPGTRYFICGVTGHCAGGMKIQIDVVASGSSTPTAPPAGAPGASPSPPSGGGDSAATKATATGFGLAAVMLAAGLMA